ncbi:MAG: ribonuclease HII [candidate division Zixibacteria bacterium]|nr:ribonuclease HII [candidate division Zixibacteria bacterium]MCI0596866.1 ribonuclease HII [candidate division Zixibacteria bacterium]
MYATERGLWKTGFSLVCGVDEAGRGPLAGPVVAGAVIFPTGFVSLPVNDCKLLTAEKRQELFGLIFEMALDVSTGIASHTEIDEFNIHQASFLAMRRAVGKLKIIPEIVLVDGKFQIPKLTFPQKAIVKGDRLSASVAAASIVAKVTRDRMMEKLDEQYPGWKFAQNKGYPTPEHKTLVVERGISEIHRKTFCDHITAPTLFSK